MKTEFLGNLSHEIKTPLTVILSDIQRIGREIRKHGFENERVSESISRAGGEIMRMSRLTDSAIKMASMQEYHDKMDFLDAALLFRTGAEGYRSIIEKRGSELEIFTEENLPLIYGNADQLISVLSNLLTNASNHTIEGKLYVTIKAKGQFIAVTVKDNGTGIPAEMLPRIFNRGVSGSGSTGMGLPICKNIVEAHGGDIHIESEAGKGTVVTFTIAVHDERKAG
jgi:signal transduction histidine kinase